MNIYNFLIWHSRGSVQHVNAIGRSEIIGALQSNTYKEPEIKKSPS